MTRPDDDSSIIVCSCGVRHHFAHPRWARLCPHCGRDLSGLFERPDADEAQEGDVAVAAPTELLDGTGSDATTCVDMASGAPTVAVSTPGRRLAHFDLLRLIGIGGMGQVHEGYDSSLDRMVAVKLIKPEDAEDSALLSRFYSEARATARINHPNVIAIHYVGCDDGQPFFAMERVVGQSVQQLLDSAEGPLPYAEALGLVIQTARGLQAAAAQDVIHRDIKPSNLLVDRESRLLKIVDFGLAKTLDLQSGQTAQGMILGTPHYMSPEQARGDPVDFHADIYALGVTFYQLLSGVQLYPDRSPLEVISAHLTESPIEQLAALEGQVPRVAIELLRRMLAKQPDQRPATYDELLTELYACMPRPLVRVRLWSRAWAFLIDAVIVLQAYVLAVLGIAVAAQLNGHEIDALSAFSGKSQAFEVLSLGLAVAYFTICHARWGVTAGKFVFGIEVVDLHGEQIGWGRSLVRALVQALMFVQFDFLFTGQIYFWGADIFMFTLLNVILVAFTALSLHDRVARSQVTFQARSGQAQAAR